MEHDNPEFEEAFGIYVGPATYDEVVAALRDLPAMSELVVRIDNRESPRSKEGIRYRHGWPEHFHEEYEDGGVRDLFVVYQHEQALGYGVMYQDAPFVILVEQCLSEPRRRPLHGWGAAAFPIRDGNRCRSLARLRARDRDRRRCSRYRPL
jgi:hypothetical protein